MTVSNNLLMTDIMEGVRTGKRPVAAARALTDIVLAQEPDSIDQRRAWRLLSVIMLYVCRVPMALPGEEIARVCEVIGSGPAGVRLLLRAMSASDYGAGYVADEADNFLMLDHTELWRPLQIIDCALHGYDLWPPLSKDGWVQA